MRLRLFFRRMTYFLLALIVCWGISVQTGCLSMRTADRKWVEKLQKAGQQVPPQFMDIPGNMGRTIHTIHIQETDSLPLVVMVHGSPGSADAYLTYLADTSIAKVARLVSFDRPGFGYTSGFGKPEGTQSVQAAALRCVVQQLAPGQKAVLVGHSLGGPIIARFAMDYPELTAGLIIVAGSIDPEQEEHPWWQKVVHVPPVKWLIPKVMWTSNAEIMPLEKELELMLPLWEKIECPVRVLHAVDDRLVPVANAYFAQNKLKNSTDFQMDILPKGDHFILWSRPELVKKAILELLPR